MATLGDIEFSVLSENRRYNNKITDHPVEDGTTVSDHVQNDAEVFTLDCMYSGPDAAQVDFELRRLRRTGEPVKYTGRATMVNAVIESYNSNVDSSIANGFNFSLTIKHVRIAKPSTIGLLPVQLRVDVKDVGNAGRVQLQ